MTVEIQDIGIDNLLSSVGATKDDTILYLGGRIDDTNLYPKNYIEYLNLKIKELNPNKILCHSHLYAWKYYHLGILDDTTQIDMIISHNNYLQSNIYHPINRNEYADEHRSYIKELMNKNPEMIYATYNNVGRHRKTKSIQVETKWFLNSDNIRYFTFNREYSPKQLVEQDLGHGTQMRNSTDAFGVLYHFIKLGFKKLTIAGFSAFGSTEDSSYFSKYNSNDSRFSNKTYFDLETSEDQKTEADILQYLCDNNILTNLENYSKLKESIQHK